MDPYPDITATWRAVIGGWTSVNGYSGYAPNYYAALMRAAKTKNPSVFSAFRRGQELHVLVTNDAPDLQGFLAEQSGVVQVADGREARQYRLAERADVSRPHPPGKLAIERVTSPCNPETTGLVTDGDLQTKWDCPFKDRQELVIQFGSVTRVEALTYSLGRYSWTVPDRLRVATSVDGTNWEETAPSDVLLALIDGGLRDAKNLSGTVFFDARNARYVRVRGESESPEFLWIVSELELRGP
jgi:hypothetical protein